jgi:cobalt/nickel transport protein
MKRPAFRLIAVGIVLCLALAIAAPFLSSDNPDVLERAAEDVMGAEGVQSQEETYYEGAPFPDYALQGSEENMLYRTLSMIIGVVVIFLITYVLITVVVGKCGNKE